MKKTAECVDVVVGLQAGSEAKGKLISVLPGPYKALIRTGSVNAAHTIYLGDEKIVFHQLPAGSVHFPDAYIILGAGAQIDLDHLQKEIQFLKDRDCWLIDGKPRLVIDANATIIDYIDKVAENGGKMPDCGSLYFTPTKCERHKELGNTCIGCEKISNDSAWIKLGSTTHGTGANLIRKIARGTKMAALAGAPFDFKKYVKRMMEEHNCDESECFRILMSEGSISDWIAETEVKPIEFASDNEFTKQFISNTPEFINELIDYGKPILLEGTQGAVLSLHHGYQNKTTSRETNAAAWCAEAGISPMSIRDIYGVARLFPIRVAGNSGPLGQEITWEQLSEEMESPDLIQEKTSATKRVRRIFRWDDKIFMKSYAINRPTKLCLTFVDYAHISDFGKSSWEDLTMKAKNIVVGIESRLGIYFNYLSTGPKQEHTIKRTK